MSRKEHLSIRVNSLGSERFFEPCLVPRLSGEIVAFFHFEPFADMSHVSQLIHYVAALREFLISAGARGFVFWPLYFISAALVSILGLTMFDVYLFEGRR